MEDWREVRARGARPYWRWSVEFVVVALVGILLFGAAQRFYRVHDPVADHGDSRALELAHLKMLGHALKLHADEHDGKFPSAISEINWRQSLPGMGWAGMPAAISRFHDPATGQVSDWLYYPGRTENDPPDTILAASPVALGKGKDRRMVVRVNGVAEIIAEADFLRPVAEPAAP